MSGSFYDEEHGEIDVPPTLVSFAVDISDTKHVVSPEFKKRAARLFSLPSRKMPHDLPVYSQIMDGYEKIYRDMESERLFPHMRLRVLVLQRLSARWHLVTAWA